MKYIGSEMSNPRDSITSNLNFLSSSDHTEYALFPFLDPIRQGVAVSMAIGWDRVKQ